MVPAPTTFTKDYQLLREAADALGFTRETQLLDRRRFDLSQPFTLLVAGETGSGKSTLINQLLGREMAAPKVGNGWVNVYRRAGEAAEYAEVYTMTDDAEVPQVVPIEQAQTMGRSAWPFEEGSLDEIEQIVWHIDAPALPEYMALAEAPTTTDYTLPNASVDGIVWVTKATAAEEPTTGLSTFSGPPPSFSVLGVLTHLDTLPEDEREACRVAMQAQMPLSVTSVVDAPSPGTSQLARTSMFKAVRDRFMLPAHRAWQRRHQQFIGHMNQVIASRFELFADHVLERHWTFNRFHDHVQRTLRDEVHTLAELIGQQIQHTQDHALAMLTAGRAPATPAPMPLTERLSNASVYLHDRAQTLLRELRVDNVPATELSAADVARYGNSEAVLAALEDFHDAPIALPEPPNQTLAPITQLMPPQSGDGTPSTAITRTEPEIVALVDTGVHALATWLRSARTAVQEQVWSKANTLYRALHGFFVEDTVAAMRRLEAYYMRLKAKALYVPTPHLDADGLTPFQFLANMQDAAFIQHWNKRYVREASNSLVTHLQEQSAEMLTAGETRLNTIWAGYAEPLHAKIKAIWSDRAAKWKPYGNAIWSLRQLMNDIPTAQSAAPFTTLPAVQAPLTTAPSLLLTEQAEAFLQRAADLDVATPEAELADSLHDRLQGRIKPEAERVWNRHQPILMRLSGEEPLRRSGLTMGLLFAVLATIWFTVAGVSASSLAVFGLYTLIHIGAAAWLTRTVVTRHIDVHAELETEGLHEAVRLALAERFTHLKTYVQRTLENATFRDELEASVLTKTLTPVPLYLGYGDLTKRLSALATAPSSAPRFTQTLVKAVA
ncbi:MAG: hypothetical protein AAGJ10_09060 [Bacteroidota bacterium]